MANPEIISEHFSSRHWCRLCNSKALELALPIAPSPIADAYIPASRLGIPQELYPLDLYLCKDCGHIQNIDIVNPELLFRDYLYTTSSSSGLVAHFKKYAADIVVGFAVEPGSLIVEIGSNDGSLLRSFKEYGLQVLGIDPALTIAERATASGIETLPDFFTASLASKIREERGHATIIAANNVFAHSDNLADIVRGVRNLLADDGVFVFEVSYLVDIVDEYLFDTVYHEHLSYHSIGPLDLFLERLGMQLFDVQRISSKGGSIRGFAQRSPIGKRTKQAAIGQMIEAERQRGFYQIGLYQAYSKRISERRDALNHFLEERLCEGKLIWGYGASTTATTLIWDFCLTRKLGCILDDNPAKHGLYSPASHIPVIPSEEIYIRRPDYIVILAWQYATPIIQRHQKYLEEGGCFVVPLPELHIIRADQSFHVN